MKKHYYSTSAYLKRIALHLSVFFLIAAMVLPFAIADPRNAVILIIPLLFAFAALFLPAIYYIFCSVSAVKSIPNCEIKEGVVTNWYHSAFQRGSGCIAVKEGDREYTSSEIFSYDTASELVGKQIRYVIIDDDLVFILAVLSDDEADSYDHID